MTKSNLIINIFTSFKRMLIYILGMVLISGCLPAGADQGTQTLILASAVSPTGFQKALPPAQITFPEDFGSHPNFQTEWWYYTGNLSTEDGRHFGYQLTFFRRALIPQSEQVERNSSWAADQIYLAHFAITDVQGGVHSAFERFARGAVELAGAQAEPYQVWLEDWYVTEKSPGNYQMRASQEDYSLDLSLNDSKGPVLQGNNGYSQKGPEPGNASYYYSQTRLESEGIITIGETSYPVTGLSWKDHEYSTSVLSGDQVGWDWFALQLNDGTELKVYNLRLSDGSVDDYSSGSYVDAQGQIIRLGNGSFEISPQGTWTSPRTGAVYPSGWQIRVPELNLTLEVEPYIKDQELNVSYSYWEGAVRVRGSAGALAVQGSGYAELTGYAQSMAGEF